MGNANFTVFKVCGSRNKKENKSLPDSEQGNLEDDHKVFIQRNRDEYFKKEDYERILEKYPQFKEWINQSENAQDRERVKPKKIRWREGKLIGHGSYGKVVMGLDSKSGRMMAVKQVQLGSVNTAAQQEKIRSLEVEIDLLSLFSHKNIVSYYGAQRSKNTFNIFLEYMPGGTIASLLDRYGPLNEDLIRVYTRQILEGLEYLHVRGTVHRDIKGANVLVDNSGVCKLADFGTARRISSLVENDPKGLPSLKGTVNWMAPEIIRQASLGRFCDIWSVGCTVIEMATAKAPWANLVKPNTSSVAALYQIAKAKTSPPIPKNLSPEAVDFLKQCFQINPRDRSNVMKLLQHKFIVGSGGLSLSIKCFPEDRCTPRAKQTKRPSQEDQRCNVDTVQTPLKETKKCLNFPKALSGTQEIEKKVKFDRILQTDNNDPNDEGINKLETKKFDLVDYQTRLSPRDNNLPPNKPNSLSKNQIRNSKLVSLAFPNTDKGSETNENLNREFQRTPEKDIMSAKSNKAPLHRPLGKSPRALHIKKIGYSGLLEDELPFPSPPISLEKIGTIYTFTENSKTPLKENLEHESKSQNDRKLSWRVRTKSKFEEPKKKEEDQIIQEKLELNDLEEKKTQNRANHWDHRNNMSNSRDSDQEGSLIGESTLKNSRSHPFENSSCSVSAFGRRTHGLRVFDMNSKSIIKDVSSDRNNEQMSRKERKIEVIVETQTVELTILPRRNEIRYENQRTSAQGDLKENQDPLDNQDTIERFKSSDKTSLDKDMANFGWKDSRREPGKLDREYLQKFNLCDDLNKIYNQLDANNSPLGY